MRKRLARLIPESLLYEVPPVKENPKVETHGGLLTTTMKLYKQQVEWHSPFDRVFSVAASLLQDCAVANQRMGLLYPFSLSQALAVKT